MINHYRRLILSFGLIVMQRVKMVVLMVLKKKKDKQE